VSFSFHSHRYANCLPVYLLQKWVLKLLLEEKNPDIARLASTFFRVFRGSYSSPYWVAGDARARTSVASVASVAKNAFTVSSQSTFPRRISGAAARGRLTHQFRGIPSCGIIKP